MKSNYALSAYSLSKNFQSQTEFITGEAVQFVLLSELRKVPVTELVRILRSWRPNKLYLPLEDKNSRALLPILQLIAWVAKPEQIIVVQPDLSLQIIKLNSILFEAFNLCKATLFSYCNYKRACRKLKKLLVQPVINCKPHIQKSDRVLYLNANLWFGIKAGGSVGHITGVVNALVKKGLQVDYAAVDKYDLLSPLVHYISLPVLTAFGIPSELNYYYFNKLVIQHLLYLKKKSDWDFIYQRMSVANFSGVILSRHLNIPLLLEYNGSEVWVAKNWGKGLRYHENGLDVENVCLRHASLIVTISEVLKQELIARGISPNKIVCYPNCIDPTLYNPTRFSNMDNQSLRAIHHIDKDAIVFTFVGTFGPWHGVDILAKAIKFYIDHDERWLQLNKVHFLLVGDGALMSEVKAILQEHLSKSYITFTGVVPQQQTPEYLAASDVLLSPHVLNSDGSRFFGSPTKLFEYMAMGKAIIASDLEQIGEVLKQSLRADKLPVSGPDSKCTELSILCEPGSVEHLIQGIRFLTENDQWRKALGVNASMEAFDKYTWERHVEKILSSRVC